MIPDLYWCENSVSPNIVLYLILDTSRGNIGLIITQILGLTGTLQWLIRNIAELENQMTSVERVVEYTKVPQESALESALGNAHKNNVHSFSLRQYII